MRIFGFEISRSKAVPTPVYASGHGGWHPLIEESSPGAWQRNIVINRSSSLANPIVFACITRIAQDGAKLPMVIERQDGNIWKPEKNSAYSKFLRQPNHYQNHTQFKESWFLSKVINGNTFALKQRDLRGVVSAQYVLDPNRVRVLQADDSSVYYELRPDKSSGLAETVTVPASEIIHDRFNTIYHPLLGQSPMFAAAYAVTYGESIQNQSTAFFQNNSQPGGILVAPQKISQENADRIKEYWEQKFSGNNAGKVAVLGDGMKYERLSFLARESQLIEQLEWTSEAICTAFHMPRFMVGIGDMPGVENTEAQTMRYYLDCFQIYVEQFEAAQTVGMELATDLQLQLDENKLLRMDKSKLYETIAAGIRGGFLTPNEGREQDNRPALKGGDTVFLQEQDHTLEALANRDAGPDPFGKAAATPPSDPAPAPVKTAWTSRNVRMKCEGHYKKKAAA